MGLDKNVCEVQKKDLGSKIQYRKQSKSALELIVLQGRIPLS